MGLKLKRKEANAEFEEMDANGGGVVLFDEFCVWYTEKINPEREIATSGQFVEKRKPIPRKKKKKEAFVKQSPEPVKTRREILAQRHRTNKPNFNLYLNSSMM